MSIPQRISPFALAASLLLTACGTTKEMANPASYFELVYAPPASNNGTPKTCVFWFVSETTRELTTRIIVSGSRVTALFPDRAVEIAGQTPGTTIEDPKVSSTSGRIAANADYLRTTCANSLPLGRSMTPMF
jgi:hypothetical protein